MRTCFGEARHTRRLTATSKKKPKAMKAEKSRKKPQKTHEKRRTKGAKNQKRELRALARLLLSALDLRPFAPISSLLRAQSQSLIMPSQPQVATQLGSRGCHSALMHGPLSWARKRRTCRRSCTGIDKRITGKGPGRVGNPGAQRGSRIVPAWSTSSPKRRGGRRRLPRPCSGRSERK